MSYLRTATIAIAFVAAVLGLSSPAAKAILIDDFSNTAYAWPLVLTSVGTTSGSDAFSDGVAGIRTVSLTIPSNPGSHGPAALIWIPDATPVLEFSEGTFHAASMTLAYSGFAADLSASPVLDIAFVSYDAPTSQPLPFTVSANGSAPLDSSYTNGAGHAYVDLSTLSGVDLSNVTSLTLAFTPPKGSDFALAQVGTVVPEPAYLGFAVAAAVLVRRRR